MGACASKVKSHRKKWKYKDDKPQVQDEDTSSVLYEDIENYTPVQEVVHHDVLLAEPAECREKNMFPAPGMVRSLTELSRDSAYSDDNFNSKNTSFTSLTHHATDEPDGVQSMKRRHRIYQQQTSRSSNYESYNGYCIMPKRHIETSPWEPECCEKEIMPSEAIPYMIEVFMPLLQGSIRVIEIIPHLPFIDDTDSIRSKDRESPREAVVLLIERIKSSQEPGKWQAFLEALSRGGYKYIFDLLKGETEKDLTKQRKLLRLFTPRLVNRIEPKEFIDHLYEKDVIGESDMEQIQCEERNRGPIAASLMLLEYMPRKNPDWYDIFLDVLKKCGLEDMVDDFHIPAEHDVDTDKCSSRPFHQTATSQAQNHRPIPMTRCLEGLDRHGNASMEPFSYHEPNAGYVSTDQYLTPTYDDQPYVLTRKPVDHRQGIGGEVRKPSAQVLVDEAEANLYTRPSITGNATIANLLRQKDDLAREIEETRVKKMLERDINQLKKELQFLQDDNPLEEPQKEIQLDASPKLSGVDELNYNKIPNEERQSRIFTDSEAQTEESDIVLCQVQQEVENIKQSMMQLKDDLSTKIQTMKYIAEADKMLNLPLTNPTSHLVPVYSSKTSGYVIATPHFNGSGSLVDSGAFSDYITSSGNYASALRCS